MAPEVTLGAGWPACSRRSELCIITNSVVKAYRATADPCMELVLKCVFAGRALHDHTALQTASTMLRAGAYRVFSCDGSNTDDVILAAADRALADGMDIINLCAHFASRPASCF